jgi:hypothetical protein
MSINVSFQIMIFHRARSCMRSNFRAWEYARPSKHEKKRLICKTNADFFQIDSKKMNVAKHMHVKMHMKLHMTQPFFGISKSRSYQLHSQSSQSSQSSQLSCSSSRLSCSQSHWWWSGHFANEKKSFANWKRILRTKKMIDEFYKKKKWLCDGKVFRKQWIKGSKKKSQVEEKKSKTEKKRSLYAKIDVRVTEEDFYEDLLT